MTSTSGCGDIIASLLIISILTNTNTLLKSNERKYDGIHLRGEGASRHFTYRAVNALEPILIGRVRKFSPKDFHATCPQTLFQRQSQPGFRSGESDSFSQSESRYPTQTYRQTENRNKSRSGNQKKPRNVFRKQFEVPTYNRFETLSSPNQGN